MLIPFLMIYHCVLTAAILNGTRVPFYKLPVDSESSEDEEVDPSLDGRMPMPRKMELEKLLNCLESVVDDLYTLSVIVRQKPLSYDRYLKSSELTFPDGRISTCSTSDTSFHTQNHG